MDGMGGGTGFSVFKVTVTKVELYNGTSFVTVFTGSAQLDMIAGGGTMFPGITDLVVPAGTYSKVRATFKNSFTIKGTAVSGLLIYYTTAATMNADSAAIATLTAADAAAATLRNTAWGNLGDAVVQTFDVGPIVIVPAGSYVPTLNFPVAGAIVLGSSGGTNYLSIGTITPWVDSSV